MCHTNKGFDFLCLPERWQSQVEADLSTVSRAISIRIPRLLAWRPVRYFIS